MFLRFLASLFGGKPKGAFVIARAEGNNQTRYYVRPSVIVLDDDEMRFRNFTDYKVTVTAKFLSTPIDLAPKGDKDKGDHKKVKLDPNVVPDFYEYDVRVFANPPFDAIGDSRPGAIIDG